MTLLFVIAAGCGEKISNVSFADVYVADWGMTVDEVIAAEAKAGNVSYTEEEFFEFTVVEFQNVEWNGFLCTIQHHFTLAGNDAMFLRAEQMNNLRSFIREEKIDLDSENARAIINGFEEAHFEKFIEKSMNEGLPDEIRFADLRLTGGSIKFEQAEKDQQGTLLEKLKKTMHANGEYQYVPGNENSSPFHYWVTTRSAIEFYEDSATLHINPQREALMLFAE